MRSYLSASEYYGGSYVLESGPGYVAPLPPDLSVYALDANVVHLTGTELITGTKKFGSSLNYSTFESDGTLKFVGDATVIDDINTSVVPHTGGGAVPAVIAFNGDPYLKCIAFSGTNPIPDELPTSLEVLHGYKEGSDIRLHFHWYPTDNNSGNVKWQLRYVWFDHDTVPGAGTTVSVVETVAVNTAWLERASVFVISGTGKHMGSRFVYCLFRDPTDAQDTYAHNAAMTDLGLHYEKDTVGSRTTLTK